MSVERSPQEAVTALYDAFLAGDFGAVELVLADDVQYTYLSGGPSPQRLTRRGKAEVRSFLMDISQQADLQDFSVHRILPSATTVVVQGSETARLKQQGIAVTSDWVQVFDVQAGAITHMAEYSIPVPSPTAES
ncbi:Ketosteroid isomerase-related protein [Nonomuraea solani]|uniref:Ketosteroid isomerase-related protein n=1 Tax=Nonomuraea solani TaxID=1144553 RepID=A0A1H5YBU5_9ACTN|nr:nuclear transport factor 2 family protein [Nonomuraea solani]SEG21444.1 Ketosteroid isomerase-related protein [Nonomuraea solani]